MLMLEYTSYMHRRTIEFYFLITDCAITRYCQCKVLCSETTCVAVDLFSLFTYLLTALIVIKTSHCYGYSRCSLM